MWLGDCEFRGCNTASPVDSTVVDVGTVTRIFPAAWDWILHAIAGARKCSAERKTAMSRWCETETHSEPFVYLHVDGSETARSTLDEQGIKAGIPRRKGTEDEQMKTRHIRNPPKVHSRLVKRRISEKSHQMTLMKTHPGVAESADATDIEG